MKSVLAWVGLAWLCEALFTALGARMSFAHLLPDATVIAVAFLAMRREPVPVVIIAGALGYLAGRQALAPFGLHEFALIATAVGTYLAAGSLAGSGTAFAALATGGALMFYHLLLYLLGELVGGGAGFTGWPTALLVPSAVLTTVLAFVAQPWLLALDRKLAPEAREELSW